MGTAGDTPRRLHEIRVHGVSGTRPHDALGIHQESCVPVPGTSTGRTGFFRDWTATDADPHLVEAYSWGALTSGARGLRERVSLALWLFLLPFALANVAYWSRPGIECASRTRTVTAIVMRWAGLLLTVALVATMCLVSIDLLAWQCFRGGVQVCRLTVAVPFLGEPDLLGFLARPPLDSPWRRLGLAFLVPIGGLLVLQALSAVTGRTYEATPDKRAGSARPSPATTAAGEYEGLLLRRTRMWAGAFRLRRQQRLHLAAGLGVIVLYGSEPMRQAADVGQLDLLAALGGLALAGAFVGAALSVRDGIDFLGPLQGSGRIDAAAAGVSLGSLVAGAAGAALLVWSALWGLAGRPLGMVVDLHSGDLLIGGALLALAGLVGALVWAVDGIGWALLGAAPVGAALALGLALGAGPLSDLSVLAGSVLAAGATTLMVAAGVRRHRRSRRACVAWGGAAPALLLGAAAWTALLLTTVITVGVADLLNGPGSVSAVETSPSPGQALTPGTLVVPNLVAWSVTALWPWALVVAGIALATWLRFRGGRVRAAIEARVAADAIVEDMAASVRARVRAAWTHRVERLLGLVAVVTAAVGLALVVAAATGVPPWAGLPRWASDVGLYLLGALVAAVLATIVRGVFASADRRRQVGVLWDITTFWPRIAHPFAPPCYAERVVPEVRDRVSTLLADPTRLVVLSGHSQGSVIVAAVASRLSDVELARVRIVTYGSQLRAWYGRIVPSVLGGQALGNEPLDQAWGFDSAGPDAPSPGTMPTPVPDPEPGSLRDRLGPRSGPHASPRWVNLFRRTDPIGFRVFDDHDSTLDVPVPDRDAADRLHTHSRYPFTPTYERLLTGWRG